MAKDFKASVLHVFELSIALPRIPKNAPDEPLAKYEGEKRKGKILGS